MPRVFMRRLRSDTTRKIPAKETLSQDVGTEAGIEFIRMHARIVLQETTGLHMDHAGHNSRPTWARLGERHLSALSYHF